MLDLDFTIQNGWILSAIFLVVSYIPMFFGGKGTKRLVNFSWINVNGRVLSALIMVLFVIGLVLPIFFTITTDIRLLIVGSALMLIGAIGVVVSYINYFSTPLNKLITKGLYRISRNPIYVFTLFMFLGIAVLCSSYLILILLTIYAMIQHPIILEEERFCSQTYGQEYESYKKFTRRYL